MVKAGGQELLMPALQPKENWEKTGRWNNYDTLFKFVSHYSRTELAIGPTHEEIISPLVKKFNLSYKDLPLYFFQIQNKFRDEKRVKSGILRGREFIMKDLYSFHADENDLNDYYEKMKTHYKNIFDKCGIGERTFLTFSSGGTFSKYSHEFQTITEAGEDKIFLCKKCRVAVNSEIIKEQPVCPECGSKNLKEEKAIEVGNIFKLKTKYSEPFGLKYTDKNGQKKDIIMGCYGIGLGRLMGAVAEINHDDNGIIWPIAIAPFAVHLLTISNLPGLAKAKPRAGKSQISNLKIKKFADDVYRDLQKQGVEVLYDDREEVSAGEKFADADLIGIPYRVVISEKTIALGKMEIKKRDSKEINLISRQELFKIINFRN
jgi:prolyl-tRNA synthetase